jgi:hypothetical protein
VAKSWQDRYEILQSGCEYLWTALIAPQKPPGRPVRIRPMNLEHFWYEISPFVYTASGGALLGRADSALTVFSSVLLLVAGGTIFFLRRRYTLEARENLSARRTATSAVPSRSRG